MLYIMRTACPSITLMYAAKGKFDGDDAFILPFKAWLDTDAGHEFCERYQIEGFFNRRLHYHSDTSMKNTKAAKDGTRYSKQVSLYCLK